jgi:signal peptidase I
MTQDGNEQQQVLAGSETETSTDATDSKHGGLRSWLEFAGLILFIFAARSSFADWNHVPSGSMKPTIAIGDLVFVERLAYDLKVPFTTRHIAEWDDPVRGDIIVFISPLDGERLIKRVIGIPGDVIAMRDRRLFINGQAAEYQPMEMVNHSGIETLDTEEISGHEFLIERVAGFEHPIMLSQDRPSVTEFGPVTVPMDSYLVLGDNRDHSADSRFWGYVPRDNILGRAQRVIASFDYDDYYLPRSDRWFHLFE